MSHWDFLSGLIPNYSERKKVRNAIRSSLIEIKHDISNGDYRGIGANSKAGLLSTPVLNEYHKLINELQDHPLTDYSDEEMIAEIDRFIIILDRENVKEDRKKYLIVVVFLFLAVLLSLLVF